ncbi:MAG TPA: MaoC/PaaZ C-terminal domain-containing protein [Ktedonobacteraceae bacterium]|nr:MaoC/PaaZ C-terminal domain-containing protein [Ktedonobacteraceae bacterium]
MSILDIAVGQELIPFVKPPIAQEQLKRYAEASGDFNPIHLDEEAAHRVGLDSIIAHGMLSMAFLGQFLQQQLTGIPGARIADLRVRYVSMVRLGDMLTCLGVLKERATQGDEQVLTVECWAQNQHGEKVTTGEAVLIVPLGAEVKA